MADSRYTIVLDTSALFMPFERGIDLQRVAAELLPGAGFVVPKPIVEEVGYLAANGRGKQKRFAKMALTYLIRFDEYKIGGKGDDTVIQTARQLERDGARIVIGTGDKALRARARGKGWLVLTVKGHQPFLDGEDAL